ncbi:MAG: hypothetical protein UH249_02080 [Acutalibacteraceae bacterium]|nr:hypothetical protein [Acutalibacteraceae bacterium]
MKRFEVLITAGYEKRFTVDANTMEEAENKIDDILESTNLLDVKKDEVDYLIEIEAEEDIDDESDCDDCPYYDGEECLFDELY